MVTQMINNDYLSNYLNTNNFSSTNIFNSNRFNRNSLSVFNIFMGGFGPQAMWGCRGHESGRGRGPERQSNGDKWNDLAINLVGGLGGGIISTLFSPLTSIFGSSSYGAGQYGSGGNGGTQGGLLNNWLLGGFGGFF